LDECDDLGVIGFRRILHVMPDELSTTATFRKNVRALGDRGKPFDLCMLPKQLGLGAELAQACDNTTIVLNHCGVPDIAGGGLDPWRADVAALAALPNVHCKLSGLLAYCAPGNATKEAMQPYVDHVLEVFGPARLIWGSDWPVVELANGLPDWLSVTQSLLASLSADEAESVGHGNARRLFNLS
jgi:predicted TIM-barrel fold metal-dependent hydrolase